MNLTNNKTDNRFKGNLKFPTFVKLNGFSEKFYG